MFQRWRFKAGSPAWIHSGWFRAFVYWRTPDYGNFRKVHRTAIWRTIKSKNKTVIPYSLTKEDQQNINKLVEEKYSAWEWNYGNSPDYDTKKTIECPCGKIEVFIKVEQGIIKDVEIYGDFFADADIKELEKLLKDQKYKCDELLKALKDTDLKKYFGDMSKKLFVESLF